MQDVALKYLDTIEALDLSTPDRIMAGQMRQRALAVVLPTLTAREIALLEYWSRNGYLPGQSVSTVARTAPYVRKPEGEPT